MRMQSTVNNPNALQDKVALVTGGGRGIGRGCAEALANAGATVYVAARSEDELQAVAATAPERIVPWVLDVTGDDILGRIDGLQRLDVLVNNAGGNRPQPFTGVDDESLDFILDLNVRAPFRIARAAARIMLAGGRGGSIVNMSSQMGRVGAPERTVYCMTKHAIEGLTKAMAVELAPRRIRVNAVAPTFVETPLTRPMLADPAFRRAVLEQIPLGELATVDDVVAAVLFLVSPAAARVTGHSLLVDGGWTAR